MIFSFSNAAMNRTELYPALAANRSGMLALDPIHTMYWEESGNPNGLSVVFLIGMGITSGVAGFGATFDPGCGACGVGAGDIARFAGRVRVDAAIDCLISQTLDKLTRERNLANQMLEKMLLEVQ